MHWSICTMVHISFFTSVSNSLLSCLLNPDNIKNTFSCWNCSAALSFCLSFVISNTLHLKEPCSNFGSSNFGQIVLAFVVLCCLQTSQDRDILDSSVASKTIGMWVGLDAKYYLAVGKISTNALGIDVFWSFFYTAEFSEMLFLRLLLSFQICAIYAHIYQQYCLVQAAILFPDSFSNVSQLWCWVATHWHGACNLLLCSDLCIWIFWWCLLLHQVKKPD